MSEKHTPGPWYAISRHNGTVNIESASGAILGASVTTDRLTSEEVRYNAKLWAAGTELLKVCKEYLRIYCDSDMRPEDECAELYSRIKAAIAKAGTP